MASVVNCQLVQVAGHTYRVRSQPIGGQPLEQQQYEEEESGWQAEDDAMEDAELIDDSLVTQEGNIFVTRIHVDPEVLPFVIGKERHKQKEVEAATGATLHIPRPAQRQSGAGSKQQQTDTAAARGILLGASKSETITIKAPSKQALSSARIRTELLISSAINSRLLDYSHFVSLPLTNEHTAAKLQEFQDKVLGQPGAKEQGIEPSIFINPNTLHLTLLMLKLYSDEARHRAREVLKGLAPEVQELLAGKPLTLQLAGLDHMSDDPTDMHVLYLKVQDLLAPGQRLAALCDMVVARFKEAGLMVPGQLETVKLHATIINTRHRRSKAPHTASPPGGKPHSGGTSRVGFDGRELLRQWADLNLGTFEVPAIHLSQRGAYDSKGYYACMEALSLLPV